MCSYLALLMQLKPCNKSLSSALTVVTPLCCPTPQKQGQSLSSSVIIK